MPEDGFRNNIVPTGTKECFHPIVIMEKIDILHIKEGEVIYFSTVQSKKLQDAFGPYKIFKCPKTNLLKLLDIYKEVTTFAEICTIKETVEFWKIGVPDAFS